MKLSIVTKFVLYMKKMASNAFKYGTLISKVTIMIFFKRFSFGGLVRFILDNKKGGKSHLSLILFN